MFERQENRALSAAIVCPAVCIQDVTDKAGKCGKSITDKAGKCGKSITHAMSQPLSAPHG